MWFELRKENLTFLYIAPVTHLCDADVAAPRSAVFAALSDPRTWSDWFPGVRAASYAGEPPYGVGTIRRAHVGATHWVEEIIAWDQNTRWAYTVTRASVPFAKAQVESFDLADTAGGTHVRWTLGLEPRLLARLGAPFAAPAIRRVFYRAMKNLNAYLQPAAGDSRGRRLASARIEA
jgi:carbon monoxide dehydrogenase subunit G